MNNKKDMLEFSAEDWQNLYTSGKRSFWFVTLLGYAAIIVLGFMLLDTNSPLTWSEEAPVSWGEITFFLLGVFTLVSFRSVTSEEIGMKLFVGKILYPVEPGLVFIPWFFKIIDLRKDPREWHLIIFEDTAVQDVVRSSTKQNGEKSHMKVFFTAEDKPDPNDPLTLAQKASLEVTLRIRIRADLYGMFIVSLKDINGAAKIAVTEFKGLMETLTPKYSAKEFYASLRQSPDEITGDQKSLRSAIEDILDTELGKIGLDVRPLISEIILPDDVTKLHGQIREAIVGGEAEIKKAEKQKQADIHIAEGQKALTKKPLEGKYEALKEAAKGTDVSLGALIQAEVATTFGEHGANTIWSTDGDLGGIGKLGTALGLGQETAKNQSSKKKDSEKTSKKTESEEQ